VLPALSHLTRETRKRRCVLRLYSVHYTESAQRLALPTGRRAKIKLREQITARDKIMLGARTVPTSQVDALLGRLNDRSYNQCGREYH